MFGRVARQIHQLNRDVDLLARRVRLLRAQDIALAQDRLVALDGEARALVVVGDERVADDDAFARLELDLECHGLVPWVLISPPPAVSAVRVNLP